jgi:preprotein translocase subunit SecD
MESTFKKLATHLTREERLKYISEAMSEERRNAMADELTIMDVEYIDALNAATREEEGETSQNKKKADEMTEALLDETLKQIDKN